VPALLLPRREAHLGRSFSAVGFYIALIAMTEACIAFVSPLLGAVVYSLLLVVMLTHAVTQLADDERRDAEGRTVDRVHAILGLAFLPLIRLISMSAPVGGGSETIRFLIVGGATLAAIAWAARVVRLPGLALRPRQSALEFGSVWLGVPLVFGAYFAIRPASVAEGDGWLQLGAAAFAVGLAGVMEELIFRGFIQSAFARLYGPSAAPFYGTAVYVISYLGVRPLGMIVFAGVLGLLFGWVVQRTQSLLGVSVSHSLINIGLFVLLPHAVSSATHVR
jgi:uncharacterized protein